MINCMRFSFSVHVMDFIQILIFFTVSLDEIKQDLSSFRYDVLNNSKTSQKQLCKEISDLRNRQTNLEEMLRQVLSALQSDDKRVTRQDNTAL